MAAGLAQGKEVLHTCRNQPAHSSCCIPFLTGPAGSLYSNLRLIISVKFILQVMKVTFRAIQKGWPLRPALSRPCFNKLLVGFFQCCQYRVHALAEELQPYRFVIAELLVDAANFADAGVFTRGAVVVEFTVSPFDLPAGQELIGIGRAFSLD